jgi:hypothetical protein
MYKIVNYTEKKFSVYTLATFILDLDYIWVDHLNQLSWHFFHFLLSFCSSTWNDSVICLSFCLQYPYFTISLFFWFSLNFSMFIFFSSYAFILVFIFIYISIPITNSMPIWKEPNDARNSFHSFNLLKKRVFNSIKAHFILNSISS